MAQIKQFQFAYVISLFVCLQFALVSAQVPPKRSFSLTSPPYDLLKLPNGFNASLYYTKPLPGIRALTLGPTTANSTIVFASSAGASTIIALLDSNNSGTASTMCTLYQGSPGAITNGIAYDANTDTLYAGEIARIFKIENAGEIATKMLTSGNCQSTPISNTSVTVLYTVPPPANTDAGHGRRALALSDDGKTLYFSIAGPGNTNLCVPPLCTVQKLDVSSSSGGSNSNSTTTAVPEIEAQGLRNPAGLTIDPRTNLPWAAIMGRDNLWPAETDPFSTNQTISFSDNAPDDTLVYFGKQGLNFQFPYCHWQGNGDPYVRSPGPGHIVVDDGLYPSSSSPSTNMTTNNSSSTAVVQPPATKTLASWNESLSPYCVQNAAVPVQALGPHVAAIGLRFYDIPTPPQGYSQPTQNFPKQFSGNDVLFVAEHGSWDRSTGIGYRVAMLRVSEDGKTVTDHQVFIDGWLQGDKQGEQFYWGRPVDVLVLPDGSLLVSDDDSGLGGGAIYRVTYDPSNPYNVDSSDNSGVTSDGGVKKGLLTRGMSFAVLVVLWLLLL